MAREIGHNSQGLVDLHQKKPTELGLLSEQAMVGTINGANARLSDLGLAFCANIENYEIEVRGEGNAD
jgi:hypothetical protein